MKTKSPVELDKITYIADSQIKSKEFMHFKCANEEQLQYVLQSKQSCRVAFVYFVAG